MPSGIVFGALVLGAAFFLPAVLVVALLALIATVAVLEFYRLLDFAGIPGFRVVGALAAVALVSATGCSFLMRCGAKTPLFEAEILVMFIAVIAVLIRQFPQKNNTQPLATVACTLLGIFYVPLLFNFFTRLAFTWDDVAPFRTVPATGVALSLYLIVVVKLTDIGAFFTGRYLGRHKLIPRISPGKTWEGFVGGILVGLFTSVAFYVLGARRLGMVHWRWVDAIVLGLLLPLFGTVGDLTESMLKRASGAKDSGALVPGMGGLLDVLDSLLFTAPVLYFYVMLMIRP